MALTDLEKAQNKAARLVRDRAHRARVVLLRQAVEKAENGPEVIQAKEAFEQAARAGQEVLDRHNAQMDALRTEIRKLKQRLAQYEADANQELIDLTERSRSLARAWRELRDSNVREAEAQFPDLAGEAEYAVSCWQIPQDAQDEMERAWQNAGKVVAATKEKFGC